MANHRDRRNQRASSEEFLVDFHEMIANVIDADGLRMGHGLAAHVGGARSLWALALDNPLQAYGTILGAVSASYTGKGPGSDDLGPIRRVAFGWDRYSLPGQGRPYADFVSVHYYEVDEMVMGLGDWKFGAIDYRPPSEGQEKVVEPLRWEIGVWNDMLLQEYRHCLLTIMQNVHNGTMADVFKHEERPMEGAGE